MASYYIEAANLITVIAFLAAFVCTFWHNRLSIRFAAILFAVGCLASIGVEVCWRLFGTWFMYHMTDSSEPNTIALLTLILPVIMAGYAIASCILLLPGIPQLRAVSYGKILHLVVLPVFVLILFVGAFFAFQGEAFGELKWLVYGPLWFCIREKYSELIAEENLF